MRRTLCSVDLVGQSDPGLRHIKKRDFAPAIREPLSDLEAMGGVQPVARYNFAGGHSPSPVRLFTQIRRAEFVPPRKEKIVRKFLLASDRSFSWPVIA